MKKIFIIVLAMLMVSCATHLSVHKLPHKPIDKSQREFILLTSSGWDTHLRVAFAQHGFKIKKFATIQSVRESTTSPVGDSVVKDERSYREAGARYSLSLVEGKKKDWCPFNEEIKANFSLELSDLATNEVIQVMRMTDWTGLCGPFSVRDRYVFEHFADAVANKWKE